MSLRAVPETQIIITYVEKDNLLKYLPKIYRDKKEKHIIFS